VTRIAVARATRAIPALGVAVALALPASAAASGGSRDRTWPIADPIDKAALQAAATPCSLGPENKVQICGMTANAKDGKTPIVVAYYQDLSHCNFPPPDEFPGDNGNYIVSSVSIQWGDGTSSKGVAKKGGQCLSFLEGSAQPITGTHAYKKAGTYRATVSLKYVRGPGNTYKNCPRGDPCEAAGGPVTSVIESGASKLRISGTVRDEFRRGLAGVRVSVTGPESETVLADAGGRYELRLAQEGTYELTAVAPRPHGQYERYYIVRNGVATEGTAADVTLDSDTSSAALDWELDRRLQFTLTAHDPARADGFSRTVTTLRALTQRGDPAPGVPLGIDPPADAVPRAVICTTGAGSRPLWPSLNSDGSVSPAGIPRGPDSTTNASGEVTFRIFPGTDGRPFRINGSRRTDEARAYSSFSLTIPFVPTRSRTFNRDHLARALFEGNVGFSAFGDQSVVFETLAVRQRNDSDALSGIDAVPVFTGDSKRQGIFFYSRGAVPTNSGETSPRVIGATDAGFVLENTLLQRVTSIPTLPTLREWAKGEPVVVDGADGRTFLGWPIPTTAHGGLGTCLDNGIRGERFVFASHSPVRLLLTDTQGRRLGTDATGKRHGDAPGSAFRDGETSYLVAPEGSYSLTVTGTGSGPVALESRHDGVTRVARFTARKGAMVKLNVANGVLPKSFRFAGAGVKSQTGVPLVVEGLPKRLRTGRKQKVTITVRDAFGDAVPGATLTVGGATGAATHFADASGRVKATLRASKPGKVLFTVSAPDLLPVRAQATATR
jgi:hypothetical protein